MNTPSISIIAFLAAVAGLILFILYGDWDAATDWVINNGKGLLIVLQVVGIFYAGMTSNLKLGAILIITIVTTILWGW